MFTQAVNYVSLDLVRAFEQVESQSNFRERKNITIHSTFKSLEICIKSFCVEKLQLTFTFYLLLPIKQTIIVLFVSKNKVLSQVFV